MGPTCRSGHFPLVAKSLSSPSSLLWFQMSHGSSRHLRITHRDLWTQPQGIHPHTPPSLFLCQTENRNSKSQGYRNIHSGQQETRTCPSRLCKTRHWAYLPVSSITFGVPITEEVLETHTFPPPRTKEAPSSASAEQERGPVMKLHGLSWLGLPLGA